MRDEKREAGEEKAHDGANDTRDATAAPRSTSGTALPPDPRSPIPSPRKRSLPPCPPILHEDAHCIVLNKPAGLAVQGGKGVGVSLDDILAASFPERPLLVHRLDRDTSGLVLVAKGRGAAAAFSALLGGGREGGRGATKLYLAVCRGAPEKPRGTIRLDIDDGCGGAKKSETRYRVLEALCGGDFSLLELELGTGRMHQIRRHLAMVGCPVLGDDKHGDFALNRALRKERGLRRLLLHASRLAVERAPGGSRLDVEAPLPEDFARFLEGARGVTRM